MEKPEGLHSSYHQSNSTTMDPNVTSEQLPPDKLFPYSSISVAGNFTLIVIFIIVIVWTIIGNVTVIISVRLSSTLRSSPSNILIANLAVSDLLLGALVLPFSAMVDIFGYWPIGKEPCFLWLIIDVLLCTASIWGLVVIAIDRYTATFKPIWYRNGCQTKRSIIYICIVWLISTLTSIPPLFGFGSMTKRSFNSEPFPPQCSLFTRLDFVTYSSFMTFIMPAIFLFLTYGRIYVEIRRRSREIERARTSFKRSMEENGAAQHQIQQHLNELEAEESSSQHEGLNGAPDNSLDSHNHSESSNNRDNDNHVLIPLTDLPHNAHNHSVNQVRVSHAENETRMNILKRISSRRRKDRREEKATKIMLTIMIIFIVCWLPFFIMYITRSVLSSSCPDCVPQSLQVFITWLGYVNSALNPILYTSFNLQFRKAFRDIWACRIKHMT